MNLQSIAEKAGVSVATVSRVVNNRPGVSQEKVKRVKAAIKELNFVPKTRVARTVPSLAPKGLKYGNIVVLVDGEGIVGAAELFVRQLMPICRGLARKGISPIVCMGDDPLEELPPVLKQKMVDGILLFGEVEESLLTFLDGIPMFWMTSHHEGAKSVVLHGNREIGQLASDYCKGKECSKVVVVSTSMDSEVCKSRCEAFVESANRFGVETRLLLGTDSSDQETSVLNAVEGNIALFSDADGVFFPSDRLAAYAYPALHRANIFERNIKAIISCGGERNYLSGLDPCPVSIDMGADLLGKQAVEQILWRIRYPEEKRQFSVVIHPELIE